MNADHNNPEEEKFAALFAALDKDAAPVDAKLKERLRIRSAEAFAVGLPAKSPQQKRIKRMLLIALRGLT
ncbi:unnamed protein product, partial [marine sediment metagenome]